MLRLTATAAGNTHTRPGPLRAGLVSITCLLRGLPLFFRATPATPLRVLCIGALDTIHVLRYSQPLSPQRRHALGTLLDFQACTNAAWDRKPLCQSKYQALRQALEKAGLGAWITGYLDRLRELEAQRPSVGGGFDDVRTYREGVARLSLATIAGVALNAECITDALQSTHCESDVEALFRMAMQCQIIDDVIDYGDDLSAGLPSFMTACGSPRQAIALTTGAARSYGPRWRRSAQGGVFPLEAAVSVLNAVTTFVVAVGGRRDL